VTIDQLTWQVARVAALINANLLHHLTDDQLDVLVVDVNTLRAEHLLHFVDEVLLSFGATAQREQVVRVARDGVSAAELSRVKTQWVASQVYQLDSVFNQAQALGRYWALGLPLDAGERLVERLRGVTAEQVQSVAARYFGDDQLTIATLRPQPADPTRRARPAVAGARH